MQKQDTSDGGLDDMGAFNKTAGMSTDTATMPAYVIKPAELVALNYLSPSHPRPREVEWINRGTNRRLKRSSIDMLLRTLDTEVASPSVVNLHRSAGLRAVFRNDRERDRFASEFVNARKEVLKGADFHVSATFGEREHAEKAVRELEAAGVSPKAISVCSRAGQFMDTDFEWPEGHGVLSIAGAAAGGGFAGSLLGVAVLLVPGVGQVAAAGAIAASALASVAATSGVIGATGGTIARMLTDHDVDGVSANYYQLQIKRGRIFVTVDKRKTDCDAGTITEIMKANHGKTTKRA